MLQSRAGNTWLDGDTWKTGERFTTQQAGSMVMQNVALRQCGGIDQEGVNTV